MNEPPFTLALIALNGIFSVMGFQNDVLLNKYLFHIRAIRDRREYLRMLSSGFLHGDWFHLFFNMLALYSFGGLMEKFLGWPLFLLLYFLSLIAGNLLAYLVHFRYLEYRALGASGAVSGVIFSSILFFPESKISFIFIPVGIPAYIFGVLYTLYTIFSSVRQTSNIGHEAHLGGMLCGVIFSILIYPQVLQQDVVIILAMLVPMLAYLFFIFKK